MCLFGLWFYCTVLITNVIIRDAIRSKAVTVFWSQRLRPITVGGGHEEAGGGANEKILKKTKQQACLQIIKADCE